MRLATPVLLVLALLAGCAAPADAPSVAPTVASTDQTTNPAGEDATFAPGIYYAKPTSQRSRSTLEGVGFDPIPITFAGVGFAIHPDLFVSVTDEGFVETVSPGGTRSKVALSLGHHAGRPSLSSDATMLVVQATEGAGPPDPSTNRFGILLVEVATGRAEWIGRGAVNQESPEWIPGTDQVLWTSFDPESGLDVHVYDISEKAQARTLDDAGAIHLAVSRDGLRLLEPGRLRVYDLSDGAMVADLHDEAVEALRDAGYEPDTRFAGQANRGTFPLDGDFSPSGDALIFDGAVKKGDEYGVVIARIGLDGSGLQILQGPVDVDPSWSNDHNFSQLTPTWLG